MFDIMLYPLLALTGVALLSGAYGCQMIWHKMSCLGDALSHGALLGIAVGLLMGMPKNISLLILSVIWAVFLCLMTYKKKTSTDTILAFLTQASLALAILLYATAGENGMHLMHAFLGDVLLTTKQDVIFILFLDVIFGFILMMCWKKWLLIAISPDLAAAQKIPVNLYRFVFFASIGFFMAESMQYLGALLAPAFFVIPPLVARNMSNTPLKMVCFATAISLVSALAGAYLSFLFDLPTGATIIVVGLILYAFQFFILFIKQMLTKTC